MLLSPVVGPFAVMLIFGLGYTGYRAPFVTEIVIPEGTNLPRDAEYYADLAPGRLGSRTSGPMRRPPRSACAMARSTS